MSEELGDITEFLAQQKFEVDEPLVFCQCKSAVFAVGGSNSLCYTTSKKGAELLAYILNEWSDLRRQKEKLD